MTIAAPPAAVFIIPFTTTTTTAQAELVLASTVASLVHGNWEASVPKKRNAIVRIARPAGSPHRLEASSTMTGSLTSTLPTSWTPLTDGGVESPLIDSRVDFTLELTLIAESGTEVARATPIRIITKGGMPDDLTDPADETDSETETDAAETDPRPEGG